MLPSDTSITGLVGIGPIPNGFGIQVELKISLPGMDLAAALGAGRQGPHRMPVLECDTRQYRRDVDGDMT